MHYKFILFLLANYITINVLFAQNTIEKEFDADLLLKNVSEKLSSLEVYSYDLERELNYSSEGYFRKSNWSCFLEHKKTTNGLGFIFQIDDEPTKDMFNGKQKLHLDKENLAMAITEKQSFESQSFFYNSIVTLKNVLPILLNDKKATFSMVESTYNQEPAFLVIINLGKRRIQYLGEGFDEMETSYNFIYNVFINMDTYLPMGVLQKNDENEDFIATRFSNVNINPEKPTEESWHSSYYTGEFSLQDK